MFGFLHSFATMITNIQNKQTKAALSASQTEHPLPEGSLSVELPGLQDIPDGRVEHLLDSFLIRRKKRMKEKERNINHPDAYFDHQGERSKQKSKQIKATGSLTCVLFLLAAIIVVQLETRTTTVRKRVFDEK